jgi:hypothetical protein
MSQHRGELAEVRLIAPVGDGKGKGDGTMAHNMLEYIKFEGSEHLTFNTSAMLAKQTVAKGWRTVSVKMLSFEAAEASTGLEVTAGSLANDASVSLWPIVKRKHVAKGVDDLAGLEVKAKKIAKKATANTGGVRYVLPVKVGVRPMDIDAVVLDIGVDELHEPDGDDASSTSSQDRTAIRSQ